MGFRLAVIAVALLAGLPAAARDDAPRTHMVATANPHATDAGLEILRRGGSAVDAVIAIQLVLTLVEPQSSGIGGGAFLVLHDAAEDKVLAYDGRETAPADIDHTLWLNAEGDPHSKGDMMPGGRSVGVPGVIRMFELAHEMHGKLPWADLFAPAMTLATEGFEVSPRLNLLLGRDKHLKRFPATTAHYFTAEGEPLPVGHVLKNPAFAETLAAIAADPDSFYQGPIAEDIIAAVQNAPVNPGALNLSDMAAYEPKVRDAVCGTYRAQKVCGMPPPSSGGVAILQILKILEGFDMAENAPISAASANLFSEAARLAYADRAKWLADSDVVPVPVAGLISDDYLGDRRSLVTPGEIMTDAPAGSPPGVEQAFTAAEPGEVPATTHYSVVDQWGNVAAMTSSVENAFGSRLMVRGFLLNNQLTDFTFAPEEDGAPVANRPGPRKRPLSSMSPTLVFDEEGRPIMTLGSPGGPLIISFVAKTLVGLLDWGLTMQQAIELPNYIFFGDSLIIERDSALWDVQADLEAMGYQLRPAGLTSGLQGIVIHHDDKGRWLEGGADPRREGTVAGD
ncbi:MAG: gamma-glutamyltransferase [Alphaproteobacteria bacterium]